MEPVRGPAKLDPGDCYCYLPLYIFCGRHLLAAKLRRSNIDGSAGAVEEVARIVAQIRRRWPRIRILLRGDSGFTREALMAWCEANRVDFLFGLARNERLEEAIKTELITAAVESISTGKPARRFKDFMWSTLDSWSRKRRVVGKAEVTGGDANPRFVVTSLNAAEIGGQSLARRIGLAHTQFAQSTCGTIRLKLLKVGALVRVSVRRIKVAMASACPYQNEFGLAYARLRNAVAA